MASSDPIADALTKIRNASRAGHPTVDVRSSRPIQQILEVLKREGFIRTHKPSGESAARRMLRVYLKYSQPAPLAKGQAGKQTPAITQLIRVSKPGVHYYRKAHALPRILGGMGVAVLTTSKGIMSGREAYRQRIGGELMCYVW